MIRRAILISLTAAGLSTLLLGCIFQEGPIVYATVPDSQAPGGELKLTLDIVQPAISDPALVKDKYPAIVFIHGGGWADQDLYDSGYSKAYLQEVANQGYVAVTINYRLTSLKDNGVVRYPWPTQIQDAKCAVSFLRANADLYHIDPDAIGASGISAGGHLALMLGETGDRSEFDGDFCPHKDASGNNLSSKVQAVVTLAAAADTVEWWGEVPSIPWNWMRDLLGDLEPETDDNQTMKHIPVSAMQGEDLVYLEHLDRINPIRYIPGNSTPVMLIHAEDDTVIPAAVSQSFYGALAGSDREKHLLMYRRGEEGKPIDHTFGDGKRSLANASALVWFDRFLRDNEPSCESWPECALPTAAPQ